MKIPIIIDGRMVQVEQGTMIIEAAGKAGIVIPTLCHHEAVKPYGSCRLCMVEVMQHKQRRLVTSCNSPIDNGGMEVFTDTVRVRQTRRSIIELLLARCPDVPVLQTMARQLGIEKSGLKKKGDQKCILCGLCVRFCEEVVGVSAIGLANRGTEREVATPFKAGSDVCIGCGSCSYICPTGCIEMVPDKDDPRLRGLTMGQLSLSACSNNYQCNSCAMDQEFLDEMKLVVSEFRSQAEKTPS
jgi:NADH dehydrogenase/NADH:ubiquinone oxidoreductase subunit G